MNKLAMQNRAGTARGANKSLVILSSFVVRISLFLSPLYSCPRIASLAGFG